MTTEAKGLQGLTSGFMGGSEFYNKKIQDLNSDISELEYKNIAGGGLTGAEQTKLMTTRKLKSDSETNKAIQLKAINTVADIYGTTDKGYSESRDDERSSASYKLVNYLQKDRQSTDKVSEYLGAAATSSQVSQDLNTVMQEGVEEKNSMKVRRSVINSAKINNEMSARFVDTLKDVDFSDNNQVQTVLQAEMGRLNSLVAPLGDKKGMDLYKELNTASLIQSKMFNQVRSTLAPSKNERNLYSTLEMETGRKLAQIGVTDPYEALGMSKEDYFKQQGVELPGKGTSGVAESTLSKLKGLGISDVGSLTDEISSSQLFGFGTSKTKMDTVKDSGKFNEDEIQELEKSKASAKKVKTTGEDYNTIQVNAFKGFISAISDNEQSFKTVDKQQDKYEAANLSGFSKGKRLELEYAMNRRGSSISDIKGEGLTEIAQQKFGKDVSLENLSNTQITELMQDEGVKNLDVFGKMKTGADEFEKSSLALGRVFETTSQTVEKRFALSLEKAGVAVNTFSDGITSSGDFSTKTMGFINSINDSIETMSVSGKSKKYAAEQGFQDMRKDGIADLGFKLAGVDSAADLSKVDERGLTGIDRLRKMGTLSDDQFGQVSQLRSEYESGEKDILKSKSMGMQAAGKIGQFAFQASSVGSQEFQNVTSSMLGTN